MQIHKLRVSRSVAGKKFPFDLLYLVNYRDREHIENLFDYSIVMPLQGNTFEQFEQLLIEQHQNVPHERNDQEKKEFFESTNKKPLGDLIDLTDKWFCVVPLLPRVTRKGDTQRTPNYLTAKSWGMAKTEGHGANARKRLRKAVAIHSPQEVEKLHMPVAFNEQAYLQTPGKALRPPCIMCPQYILHTQGECKLGDIACYANLPLGVQAVAEKEDDDE